jgi:hypothetical protein
VDLGTEDRKKTWTAIALFVLAVLAILYEMWPSSPTPTPTAERTTATTTNRGQSATPVFSKLDPTLRSDLLRGSETVTYQGSGRDIFHSQPEQIANVGKVPDPRTKPEPKPPVPSNPPIPLKFYGFASENNNKQIFLSQGDDVFVAREGDIVKGRYKVLHVNPNNVEIQDVLGNYSQSIPLTMPNS